MKTERRFKKMLAAIGVIAGTYAYFLIFAEFAFLELLRDAVGEAGLRVAMGALGIGGVIGSAAAVRWFEPARYARALQGGAVACAVSAGLACVQASSFTAVAIGLGLGWLTVTLVAGLRGAVGVRGLGVAVGVGTGVAYGVCNVPAVFFASARAQAAVGVAFAMVAAAAARGLRADAVEVSACEDYQPRRAAGWTAIFLALVWMDSAAFYIIQHTAALREGTWGERGSLWLNVCIHFAAACVAGVVLDRGWLGRVAGGAWTALAGACVLLAQKGQGDAGSEVLYTAGVSLYSVALVYYPARSGRALVGGVVFAVAGWLGSALGIGMAQDLSGIPLWFVGATGAVVTGVLLMRSRATRGLKRPLLGVAMCAMCLALDPVETRAEERFAVEAGREVYIAEGCIHCHSQYVRPGTPDVVRWGPATDLAEALKQTPPLFGNRRQGPDLANVGNRRTVEWNRLHLIAPRAVSPGTRMPSYAHLFREGNERGEALVAYLNSLGEATGEARAAVVAAWRAPEEAWARADVAGGAALFARLCVGCHGAAGRGDGPLASRLSVRPPDWSRDAWRRVDAASLDESLARVIKFGLPASAMAGHEYLGDDEVVSLARFVRGLHGGAQSR